MFREKRFLQKKRLLAVLLLTVLSICLVGGCGSKPVSTQDADILSSYIGFWRYEGTPTYVTINDQYQWATTDFYGNQLDSGVITTDENGLNLSRADGSFVSTLAVTDTGLVDGGGNTLVPSEGLVFLPTAADALNQTIAFPGNFGNVTINYPAQMNAYPYVSYTDSLGFDALVKNGTDDYYTNIMIGTVQGGMYKKAMEAQGIEVVYPSKERQEDVMSLIYEQIKRGEKGDRHQFMNVVHELRAQGCDAVILACTELSVLNVNYSLNPDFYIDAMNVVAKACIEKCGGVYCE